MLLFKTTHRQQLLKACLAAEGLRALSAALAEDLGSITLLTCQLNLLLVSGDPRSSLASEDVAWVWLRVTYVGKHSNTVKPEKIL